MVILIPKKTFFDMTRIQFKHETAADRKSNIYFTIFFFFKFRAGDVTGISKVIRM